MPESNSDPRDVMLNLYSGRQGRKTHDYIMAMSVVINVTGGKKKTDLRDG